MLLNCDDATTFVIGYSKRETLFSAGGLIAGVFLLQLLRRLGVLFTVDAVLGVSWNIVGASGDFAGTGLAVSRVSVFLLQRFRVLRVFIGLDRGTGVGVLVQHAWIVRASDLENGRDRIGKSQVVTGREVKGPSFRELTKAVVNIRRPARDADAPERREGRAVRKSDIVYENRLFEGFDG